MIYGITIYKNKCVFILTAESICNQVYDTVRTPICYSETVQTTILNTDKKHNKVTLH